MCVRPVGARSSCDPVRIMMLVTIFDTFGVSANFDSKGSNFDSKTNCYCSSSYIDRIVNFSELDRKSVV